MLQPVKPDDGVQITIEDTTYTVTTGRFIPKLIDFDLSRIYNDDDINPYKNVGNDDIIQIENMFKRRNDEFDQLIQTQEWDNMKNSTRFDYEDIVHILEDPFFSDVITLDFTELIQHRCVYCAQPALYNLKDTEWNFCDEECAELFV